MRESVKKQDLLSLLHVLQRFQHPGPLTPSYRFLPRSRAQIRIGGSTEQRDGGDKPQGWPGNLMVYDLARKVFKHVLIPQLLGKGSQLLIKKDNIHDN